MSIRAFFQPQILFRIAAGLAAAVILLIAGAILHLAKRRPSGSQEACMTPGEKGGLVLMGIGALLTGLMFIYIMIA